MKYSIKSCYNITIFTPENIIQVNENIRGNENIKYVVLFREFPLLL